MQFTKMHGIGNDYVYIDGSQYATLDFARAARIVSDRHFAIGSDGLIAVCAPTRADADLRMRMFNADASEGEMCGNGIRCVAKYAVDRGMVSANPLRIETGLACWKFCGSAEPTAALPAQAS
jgi:diaminopimelate epimerase